MYYEDNYEIDSDLDDISYVERNRGYRGTFNDNLISRSPRRRIPTPGKALHKSISPLYKL